MGWSRAGACGRQVLPLAAAGLAACLGGTAIVATRVVAADVDVMMLALLRYGLATLCFVPVALLASGSRRVVRSDIVPVIGLGALYFGVFPLLFTAALSRTTATRGALVISLVPTLTLMLGVALRRERANGGKISGVVIATGGVALALVSNGGALGLGVSDAAMWGGDLLMLLGALSSAAYGVLSRPYVARSGALPVMGYGMIAGLATLILAALANGSIGSVISVSSGDWVMIAWLALPGCAIAFFLLVWAYGRADPSRVAVFLTLNPIVAMLIGGLLLGEPVGPVKLSGLILVVTGIALVAWAGPARRIRIRPKLQSGRAAA